MIQLDQIDLNAEYQRGLPLFFPAFFHLNIANRRRMERTQANSTHRLHYAQLLHPPNRFLCVSFFFHLIHR
jgi:hypothetical protein